MVIIAISGVLKPVIAKKQIKLIIDKMLDMTLSTIEVPKIVPSSLGLFIISFIRIPSMPNEEIELNIVT